MWLSTKNTKLLLREIGLRHKVFVDLQYFENSTTNFLNFSNLYKEIISVVDYFPCLEVLVYRLRLKSVIQWYAHRLLTKFQLARHSPRITANFFLTINPYHKICIRRVMFRIIVRKTDYGQIELGTLRINTFRNF